MTELIINHKLDINSNMDILAESIKKDIAERYNIAVTDDTVADSKRVMAEINKQKNDFRTKYKQFRELVLSPLMPLDTKAKEIELCYDDARAAIDSQVKKFEYGKLELAKKACEEFLKSECDKKQINPQSVSISDICGLLGSVTSGGAISAKARETILSRISLVENEILKARLEMEEKAKRDKEIADKAAEKVRLEMEERAIKRESDLLSKAEERAKQDMQVALQKQRDELINKQTVTAPAPAPLKYKQTPKEEDAYYLAKLASDIKSITYQPMKTTAGKNAVMEVKMGLNSIIEQLEITINEKCK